VDEWLVDATAAVDDVALAYQALAKIGTRTLVHAWVPGGTRGAGGLPIDARPIDLRLDIAKYAEKYSSLTRGTLRTGPEASARPVDRLRFVAGCLPALLAEDRTLCREAVKGAQKLGKRFAGVVGGHGTSWPFRGACKDCGGGPLWAQAVPWTVRCAACGAEWGRAELETLARAVAG
jgi:hypothetical protein